MAKNTIVLLLTALLAATCMSASAVSQEALRPGQAISLTAIDQEVQDGVSYDYLWTVVEVDEDGNDWDDLVIGVLSQTDQIQDHLPSSRL